MRVVLRCLATGMEVFVMGVAATSSWGDLIEMSFSPISKRGC